MIAKAAGGELFSHGRLASPMSSLLLELNEKPRLEWEQKHLSSILRVDAAHVVMLAEQDLIDDAKARLLLQAIHALNRNPSGLTTEAGYGSMVLQIERVLGQALGEDVVGNLPIARSRLDQGATVRRIADRESVLSLVQQMTNLQEHLLNAAEKHKGAPMISYTHLQQAQPAMFGHYLLAFNDRLADPLEQLIAVYYKTNRSPLGAVGLSGTDLSIDRHRTATLLGFNSILENSRLGRDGYYQIEIVFALAMIMTILNDLCTELHIYSSIEFGTVELDDSHCSTSSIFPQKKNPYALETIKGKAGESHGWVATALATFRNEGTIDHAARVVGLLDNAVKVTSDMLKLMCEIVERLTVHVERSESLLDKAWVTTNRLANILMTKHGLSYRNAHSMVARLVKNCLRDGIERSAVTVDHFQQASREMNGAAIHLEQAELDAALDHREFLKHSISLGGVGPEEFVRMAGQAQQHLQDKRSWLRKTKVDLDEADMSLEKAVQGFLGTHSAHNGETAQD